MVVVAVVAGTTPALASTPVEAPLGKLAPPKAGAQALLSQAPLGFEPGREGGYVARGPGYRLALRRSELDLTWDGAARRGGALHMHFEGANPGAWLEGTDPLPSRTSYFLGADATRWRTGVPN